MEVPFRLVDVFTPRPLAGNQLCVVPEAGGLQQDAMQALAREIGFSETTFVTEISSDRYWMRIFTPGQELPFAGHPTIGTAFALVAEGRLASRATQVVGAGEIPVEVDLDSRFAWMTQLPPRFGAELADRDLLARACGLGVEDLDREMPAQVVSTGLSHVLVPVRDLEALRRAARDGETVAAVTRAAHAEAIYLFAMTEEGVTARMFDRDPSVGEDPATGSAAGPLAAYLAERGIGGLPGSMLIRQGEQVGRPSELHVEVVPEGQTWKVRVGGGVHVVGEGAFRL